MDSVKSGFQIPPPSFSVSLPGVRGPHSRLPAAGTQTPGSQLFLSRSRLHSHTPAHSPNHSAAREAWNQVNSCRLSSLVMYVLHKSSSVYREGDWKQEFRVKYGQGLGCESCRKQICYILSNLMRTWSETRLQRTGNQAAQMSQVESKLSPIVGNRLLQGFPQT